MMTHVVISGASRGLGAALARAWAAPGVTLGLLGRDGAALRGTAAACERAGANIALSLCDMRDGPALAAQLHAWDDGLAIDLLVANAGITGGTRPDGGLEGLASVTDVLAVNLQGAANLVEPMLPRFIARRAGHVVLIASVAAFRGLPDSPAYCASKAGLWAYGESLRPYLGPRGVQLTNVAPGFFESAMSARFSGDHPLQLTVDAAASRIARAVAAGRGRCIFPRRLGYTLRLLELLPAPLADRAARLFRFTISP
ncbi:MAG: SDR family NAD(P)-dependent oxidoreductase [Rubritepida sp.]|nr:SDR family NAD(P)-dependent oxidoreductase [Rubritepida sp.]